MLYNGNETAIYLYENFGYKEVGQVYIFGGIGKNTLEENPRKRSKLLKKHKKIPDNILPIRPGRSNSGRMTLRTNKNPMNKKRAL